MLPNTEPAVQDSSTIDDYACQATRDTREAAVNAESGPILSGYRTRFLGARTDYPPVRRAADKDLETAEAQLATITADLRCRVDPSRWRQIAAAVDAVGEDLARYLDTGAITDPVPVPAAGPSDDELLPALSRRAATERVRAARWAADLETVLGEVTALPARVVSVTAVIAAIAADAAPPAAPDPAEDADARKIRNEDLAIRALLAARDVAGAPGGFPDAAAYTGRLSAILVWLIGQWGTIATIEGEIAYRTCRRDALTADLPGAVRTRLDAAAAS
jgi:hypothetical protein